MRISDWSSDVCSSDLIRAERQRGATILFSTHVMAHAERLCESLTIIGDGKVRFSGTVEAARATLRARVHLVNRQADGPWRAALLADALRHAGGTGWRFILHPDGTAPLHGPLIRSAQGHTNPSP